MAGHILLNTLSYRSYGILFHFKTVFVLNYKIPVCPKIIISSYQDTVLYTKLDIFTLNFVR